MPLPPDNSYEDIIHLPHHRSTIRPCMSIHDRAAQFAPFAALTGHDAAIELDESQRSVINDKLLILLSNLPQCPEVTVTFFQPDARKQGGTYRSLTSTVRKLDSFSETMVLSDGTVIPFSRITDLDSALFSSYPVSF